jgi:hypothetical protein
MPHPLCMGCSRLATLSVLTFGVLVLAGLSPIQATEDAQDDERGALYDVRLVPASCLLGGDCNITQPTHLVEYYGADWCEPCEPVADELQNLTSEEGFVLQHHASPSDETFLSASKLRYDHEFRLIFIPSLVVDGADLLTGTRQAMDLDAVLNGSEPFSNDLDSLSANGTALSWNLTSDLSVRVWYVEPTAHETKDRIHPTLARAFVEVNASDGYLNATVFDLSENGTLVVMLERPGVRTLNIPSLAPTGPMDLSDGDVGSTDNTSKLGSGWWALGAMIALGAMLTPALLMHRGLMREMPPKQTPATLESE